MNWIDTLKFTLGNFLVVQWLRLGTFTAVEWVQSLVKELRSHKFHGVAKKQKTTTTKKKQKKTKFTLNFFQFNNVFEFFFAIFL